eukprot:CAMPEP_0201179438 /NCGR_PEP_ID=MMETSP0851-20130426/113346_1 /ASSEMBLY_ACC=CAM_ASM_000631 /TAXON_ID=183588 /ORGANISM="Pseudo-nitzschia fraudulenta, Strain WWA7" /LENGTH=343 /DNA_ID=CAMNT_0047463421 /DNA_START=55 /DNA_END=1086 /DNA_ORIENTATION=-
MSSYYTQTQHPTTEPRNTEIGASCSHTEMMHDHYYVQFLAKSLNNRASQAIASRNYDAAITDLKNALELTDLYLSSNHQDHKACSCKYCSPETCLMIAEDDDHTCSRSCEDHQRPSKAKKRKRQSTINSVDIDLDFDDESMECDHAKDEDHSWCGSDSACQAAGPKITREATRVVKKQDEAFVYSRPLRVNQKSIDEHHYMGSTLSVIILFNIALAHHLKAIELLPVLADHSDRLAILQQPLKLYELAYQLQVDRTEGQRSNVCNEENLVNLRFMMLVTNNISDIHRIAGNAKKYKMCLEHLLNAMMFMNHNGRVDILAPKERDGMYDNLSPILKSNLFAPAA